MVFRCVRDGDGDAVQCDQVVAALDGDSTLSTFELAAGSNPDNALYRAPGINSQDPLE